MPLPQLTPGMTADEILQLLSSLGFGWEIEHPHLYTEIRIFEGTRMIVRYRGDRACILSDLLRIAVCS